MHVDARKEWDRLAPELDRLGILTLVDRDTLAAYCSAVIRWRDAEVEIEKLGILVDSQMGVKPNPAIAVARDAMDQVRKFGNEFGLTPASRPKIHAKPKDHQAKNETPASRLKRRIVGNS